MSFSELEAKRIRNNQCSKCGEDIKDKGSYIRCTSCDWSLTNGTWDDRGFIIHCEDGIPPTDDDDFPIPEHLGVGSTSWKALFGRDDAPHRIAVTGLELLDKLIDKNKSYGCAVWNRATLAPECEPGAAIRVRMSDKIERLKFLLESGQSSVVGESFRDTIQDLAGYCLLLLAAPTDPDNEQAAAD